jgi:hypothetical protein
LEKPADLSASWDIIALIKVFVYLFSNKEQWKWEKLKLGKICQEKPLLFVIQIKKFKSRLLFSLN